MSNYFIGLMSGTSMDGVDGVLASFEPHTHTYAHASVPFDASFREQLLALNEAGYNELELASELSIQLVHYYHQVVQELLQHSHLSPQDINAIGAHGQTVRHRPDRGYTLQLNAPALLTELTKIAVVAEFRSRDIAAGGQGAPLVPAFHAHVFGQEKNSAILNLGGIANISLLSPEHSIYGFDTGPANLFLDMWCLEQTGQYYDKDGVFAKQGTPNQEFVSFLIDSESWFKLTPPKSTGRDLFTRQWLEERLLTWQKTKQSLPTPADIQASLVELTVQTVLQSLPNRAALEHFYVCGGGAYNPVLMDALQAGLNCPVDKTDSIGIPAQQMEALAFAWLAYAHINKLPANLPAVTGAKGPRILGAYYPV